MAKIFELTIDHVYAEKLYEEGRDLEAMGDNRAAFLKFREAAKINPRMAMAMVNAGYVSCNLGELAQAKYWFLRAARVDPQNVLAQFNLGCVLEDLKRPHDAENYYRRALRINPRCGDAIYNMAWLLEKQGRYFESIGYWQKYISVKPGSPLALTSIRNLSKMFLVRGGRSDARRLG